MKTRPSNFCSLGELAVNKVVFSCKQCIKSTFDFSQPFLHRENLSEMGEEFFSRSGSEKFPDQYERGVKHPANILGTPSPLAISGGERSNNVRQRVYVLYRIYSNEHPGRSFNFWDYFSYTAMQFFVFGLCNR